METKITKIGDIVTFGQYPQGANGEVEPLEWRVLAIEGDTALLLTEKCVDCLPYDDDDKSGEVGGNTWEFSDLRSWVNGEFLDTAFDSDERSQIAVSHNINADNPVWGTKYGSKGGNETDDKIFCLSIEEADKYFEQTFTSVEDAEKYLIEDEEWKDILGRTKELLSKEKYALYVKLLQPNADRQAYATEYAKSKGCWISGMCHTCVWWLRSPGYYTTDAADVNIDGGIDNDGLGVISGRVAVRPACRVRG